MGSKHRGMAMVLGLTLIAAGCGTNPATSLNKTTHSFKAASTATLAKLGHGLGWKNVGAAPLVNDLGKVSSLGFKTQDAPSRKADLRALASPVADQGNFGSCTAFSMVKGLKEFMELKGIRDRGGDPSQEFVPLSPAFLWFWERSYTGASNVDTGANIFLGMNLMQGSGIPPEKSYPYPTATQQRDPWFCSYFLPATPSATVNSAAIAQRGGSLKQITRLSDLKASLDEGYPVVFGFLVFSSIERVGENGMLPVPNLQDEELLGGHAVCAVGYDDDRQVIIVKNSWGPDWGDKGYFYMPYKFFDMDLGLVADGWTMRE